MSLNTWVGSIEGVSDMSDMRRVPRAKDESWNTACLSGGHIPADIRDHNHI